MKPKAFEVEYTQADEPENNYNRTLPSDLFAAMYPGFLHFAIRSKVGDTSILTLELERWSIKAI